MFENCSRPAVTMSPRQLKALIFDGDLLPIVRTAEGQRLLDAAKRHLRFELSERRRMPREDRAPADIGA